MAVDEFHLRYAGPARSGKHASLSFIQAKVNDRPMPALVDRPGFDDDGNHGVVVVVPLGPAKAFLRSTSGGHSFDLVAARQRTPIGDGVVFVADLRPARLEANLISIRELADDLITTGSEAPVYLQLNHADADDAMKEDELVAQLVRELPGLPVVGHGLSVAPAGTGVFEPLKRLVVVLLSARSR